MAGNINLQPVAVLVLILKLIKWVKLSNSGDVLKLMILNYSRKIISGWPNYPGIVTSHKMNENEMGNRGSKSNLYKLNL